MYEFSLEKVRGLMAEKGLKQIAITDHGYSHKKYGVEPKEVENIKNEIKKLPLLYILFCLLVKIDPLPAKMDFGKIIYFFFFFNNFLWQFFS